MKKKSLRSYTGLLVILGKNGSFFSDFGYGTVNWIRRFMANMVTKQSNAILYQVFGRYIAMKVSLKCMFILSKFYDDFNIDITYLNPCLETNMTFFF